MNNKRTWVWIAILFPVVVNIIFIDFNNIAYRFGGLIGSVGMNMVYCALIASGYIRKKSYSKASWIALIVSLIHLIILNRTIVNQYFNI